MRLRTPSDLLGAARRTALIAPARAGGVVLLCALLSTSALATESDGQAVDDAPPAGASTADAPVGPPADSPAADAPAEGVWAWIHRLEGEILTEDAAEAMAEKAEAELAEGQETLTAPSVPVELYEDPKKALTVDPLRLSEIDPSQFDIPVRTDPEVQAWMRYFLGRGRRHFQRYLDRSGRYVPMMQARLEARGLPKDLIYLSMIESGFNPHALSHAGAGGLWQFMPATGRMYDLRVDWWVDDRRDPVKSTDAAVAHLADLHRMFKGDWLLAWCAYNAGPGRVRGAIRRAGTRDFWKLARGGHLPKETVNYPPKLMAAAIISKNAEAYGFRVAPAPPLHVDTVEVQGAAALDMLAELAGIDVDALKSLNPGLRRAATPAEGYTLNLPSGTAPAFVRRLAEVPEQERSQFVNHTVKRGETLSLIASSYGVDTKSLVKLNRLQNADRIVVGMSLLVPRSGALPHSASVVSLASTPPEPPPAPAEVVLPSPAAPVRVEPAARSAAEPAAQGTAEPAAQGTAEPASEAPSSSEPAETAVRYAVRPGDSLSVIASRYGVGTADVARWNDIDDPSAIQVGQVLTIHKVLWRSYTVAPGDNLGRIAQRQGCSVDDLRGWNGLKGDVIHPGQTLRIRR